MASGDQDRVFRAMYEPQPLPGFRAEESRFDAFTTMAAELPSPRETIGLQLQAIMAHDTSARLAGLSVPTMAPIHGTVDRVLGVANGRQIASLSQFSPRDIRGRRPHVLVGAARALR